MPYGSQPALGLQTEEQDQIYRAECGAEPSESIDLSARF